MATILCLSGEMTGVVYSVLETSHKLAAAGHRVIYAGPSSRRHDAERLGLEFLAADSPHERLRAFWRDDARRGALGRLSSLGDRRRRAVAALQMGEFADAVRRLRPDLALIDGEMHEHVIVALSAGLDVAVLNTFSSIWRRPGLPPAHTLIRPGVGWRGSRLGLFLAWWAFLDAKWTRRLRHSARRLGCDRVAVLRELARAHGVDLRRLMDSNQWLIPFTYRDLPALSLHAQEFEFRHRPADHVRYVGPQILHDRTGRRLPTEDRHRLRGLLIRRDRPLVYASFGSTLSASPGLLRRLVLSADGRDWDLVLSLGVLSLGGRSSAGLRGLLGNLPANVHAFSWLPQLHVLARADLAVTHGGINTLDECVVLGVPVLVYCGHQTDMAGNTARVVHHGLGAAGDADDAPAAIRGRIEALLGDRTTRTRVAQMRRFYDAYESSRTLETTVDDLLQGRFPRPRGAT